MSPKKKLIKELILVSGLNKKTLGDFVLRTFVLTTAATDNPTIAPGLDPTSVIMTGKATSLDNFIKERAILEGAVAAKTVQINELKDVITNDINNSWAPEAQKAVAGDIEKAKKLAWLIKGIYTGTAIAKAIVGNSTDSYPGISTIISNNHLQHKVCTRNNLNGKVARPLGVSRIEIYMQIGGLTPPTDVAKMQDAGTTSRGNLVINFDVADLGKVVYYIAVYIDLKTKKSLIQSPVMSATIS